MRQAPPTAKGVRFITLEDECGMLNVIVRPHVYERYRRIFRTAPVLVVEGTLQREHGVTNVIVGRAAALEGF
jgi:error-prone DNA polymerase